MANFKVTAEDYNLIQGYINSTLGTGTGQTGYGQTLASSAVGSGATITATQWSNLRTDLSKIRVHQTGVAVSDGTAIGSPWQTLKIVTSSTAITLAVKDQYTDVGLNVAGATERVKAAASQMTTGTATSASRSTAWGTPGNLTVQTTFTITFSSSNFARWFFNAGGEIRVDASRGGSAVTTKDSDWTNMLQGVGTFRLGATSNTYTTANSSYVSGISFPDVSAAALGFYNLTSTAKTLVEQTGYLTNYAQNRYTITGSVNTANNSSGGATVITLVVVFRDADVGDQTGQGAAIDESVTGTLTASVTPFYGTGSNVSSLSYIPSVSATALA
jgi:hypothetical protein